MRVGGLMLVAVGVLLVTGWWDDMVVWLQVHLIRGSEVARMSPRDLPEAHADAPEPPERRPAS